MSIKPKTRAFRRVQKRPVVPEWRYAALDLAVVVFAYLSKDKEDVQKILCIRFSGRKFLKVFFLNLRVFIKE